MKQMRRNVFETNSSSTHSLTMCSQSQFDDWKAGKVLFHYWKEIFVDVQEMTDEEKESAKSEYKEFCENKPYYKKWEDLSEDEVNQWYNKYRSENSDYDDEDLKTFDDYFDSYGLEPFTSYYTSESGDKIVAFGKFGYDG